MVATPVDGPPGPQDLRPTAFLDADHPAVRAYAERTAGDAEDEREVARRLFAAVRDDVRYDVHDIPSDPDAYRASAVLARGSAYCIPKSVLLGAATRARGIPARLGFADVRNHLAPEGLVERMGTDVFAYHGFTVLWLGGRWVKASAAFNRGLCERMGVAPLDFDGVHDALLHPYDGAGQRYMEYLREHGAFADLPLSRILDALRAAYPAMVGATP